MPDCEFTQWLPRCYIIMRGKDSNQKLGLSIGPEYEHQWQINQCMYATVTQQWRIQGLRVDSLP